MVPELGSFAIILALCFALIQGITPVFANRNVIYAEISSIAAVGQFLFLIFAMLCLIASFLTNDMTVIYVHEHSHTLLPFIYRVGAAWGGHEGSLLLWCLILSGWTVAFLIFAKSPGLEGIFTNIISILGLISAGFILFLFATSNPFWREFPTAPLVGNDLTPCLLYTSPSPRDS